MNKLTKILVPVLLTLLVLGSIVWYLFVYDRAFTRDFLLNQARYHDTYGNSRISSMFYDLAYSFSGQDENVSIELAQQYKNDGNYTKAEATLTNAVYDGGTLELYIALCQTYVEQDKLLDAVNMLDNVTDPAIQEALKELRPAAPTANYDPSYYNQYIQLELSHDGETLYYTTDGDYPSIHGLTYSEPLDLPGGETTIYAISVGENGLVSPLSVLGYTVAGVIEPAVFMDPYMEQAVRSALNADADKILYTDDLWTITEFTVPEEVTILEDLAMLPSVEKLTIRGNRIGTLAYLANLTKLRELDLSGSRFPAEDLFHLASLPDLTHLTMAGCGLSTIASLATTQNLTHLDLSNNTLQKLEPLSSMGTLTQLNLSHNAITNLSALSTLSNLERLDVSFNALTSLAPIATNLKLSWLDAGNNQLATLSGMDNLPGLTYLSVEYNKLTDVAALASNTTLTELSISGNQIEDISALSTLNNLDIFDFSYNQVKALPEWSADCALRVIDGSYNELSSVAPLKGMQKLSYVYRDYNKLTTVDPIAECFCLVQVNVYGNEIPDVSKLKEHDIIVNYDPTN
ncbi:MAG: leucine-rich repeat domain-containing protein [Oscillospiraceae bacterium]|nr:leucine-rich repeat domain-containing protein [Oscillospiraceae bacterium]